MKQRTISNKELAKPFRRFAPSAEPVIDVNTGRATFIFNTEEVGRDGHIVRNAGIQKSNFERNPVILFAHNDREPPIGRATAIRIDDPASKVEIEFTPRDLYPFGATIGDMVRARYLNACSESWQPVKWHYMADRSGVIFDEVDLLEISIVPIPALPDAVATARASGIDTGPLVEWAERLLDSNGIATVQRQELESLRRAAKMSASSKRADASRLPQTDIPDKDKATTDEDDGENTQERALRAKHERALERAPKVPTFKRGLYELANLACLVESLGYAHNAAEWEAEVEGDSSAIPRMLGECLQKLGEVLVAMADEEVKELLEQHNDDDDDGDLDRSLTPSERITIAEGKTPQIRAWRRGVALARAGKALSIPNQKKLQEADAHHDRAMKHHRAMADQHEAMGGHLDTAEDSHQRMTQTLSELGEHVRAAQGASEPKEHIDAAARSYRAVEKQADDVSEAHTKSSESHEDLGDSHHAMGRSVKRAQGYVRSVLDASHPDEGEDASDKDDRSGNGGEGERARQARESRATRAREIAQQSREPIVLDLN